MADITDVLEQFREIAEEWKKYPSTISPNYPSMHPQGPCPDCGRCPTCGAGGRSWPVYPRVTW